MARITPSQNPQTLKEQSVYSVGRYGEWKYSSMQEAVLDGKKIAEKLVVIPAHRIHEEIPLVLRTKEKVREL